MPARRLLAATAAAALFLLALVPATLADGPDVTGTVTKADGSPAAGVEVHLTLAGGDMAWTATTDDKGAWSATTGVQSGQTLSAWVLLVSYSSPDPSGCVSSTGQSARADVAVDALPVAPISLVLGPGPNSRVCAATATPRAVATPPATDTTGHAASVSGGGSLLVAGALAAVAMLALGPVRRPRRR